MSRYAPKQRTFNHSAWLAPLRHYIITTDQRIFEIDRRYLDYKETISRMRRAGYTGININCVGYNVTI